MPKTRQKKSIYAIAVGGVLSSLLIASAYAQNAPCEPGAPQLIIYHAGSLTAAFTPIEKLFTQQTGICVIDVSAGSIDAARRITAGKEPCDIFASADDGNIDQFLKPADFADYNIRFAQGRMVLAYTTASKNADAIAATNVPFDPPSSIPNAAADWYTYLIKPGVVIGGSNPFLDPSGYRADMIFQLTENHYRVPNLYNTLLGHYALTRAPKDVLGKTYDYQFTYEHSAMAAYKSDTTKSYRYVSLPDSIDLSNPEKNQKYKEASVTMSGLHTANSEAFVRIPGSRVEWGVTVLKNAPNRDNAIQFLQLLFSKQGTAIQAVSGPTLISPPKVERGDYERLPNVLKPLVLVESKKR